MQFIDEVSCAAYRWRHRITAWTSATTCVPRLRRLVLRFALVPRIKRYSHWERRRRRRRVTHCTVCEGILARQAGGSVVCEAKRLERPVCADGMAGKDQIERK